MAVRKTLGKRIGRRIYRGQRDPRWLLSSVFERSVFHLKRNDPGTDVNKAFEMEGGGLWRIREGYLDRFCEYARGLPGLPSSMTPEDWWILGRHHGLVTPILDWSESPYIAAFFALNDYMESLNPGFKLGMPTGGIKWGEGSIAIWELVETEGMEKDEFSIIRPETEFSVHSLRIRAQKSVFTKLTHDVHMDLESYLRSRDLISCLERYDISGIEAAKALRDLELMNITSSDLFPDLGGGSRSCEFWVLQLAPYWWDDLANSMSTYASCQDGPETSWDDLSEGMGHTDTRVGLAHNSLFSFVQVLLKVGHEGGAAGADRRGVARTRLMLTVDVAVCIADVDFSEFHQ